MAKNKNKKELFKQKVETLAEDYDSMIENGTSSEESDNESGNGYSKKEDNKLTNGKSKTFVSAKNKEINMSDNDDSDSDADTDECDDGFSDEEVSPSKQPKLPNGKANVATVNKRITAPGNKFVEKVKPPTLEEINELKETRNLHHSNMFRLQVKEMLAQTKIKEKYNKRLHAFMEHFKIFLHKLESQSEPQHIDQMQWLVHSDMHTPLALEQLKVSLKNLKKKKCQFQFLKPTIDPQLIGASATQTLAAQKLIVADVCLTMPAACFHKDDYLNLVYDQKRAYYLTYLANELIKNRTEFADITLEHMNFNYFENNPLKPTLLINLPANQKLCIRVFVVAEEKLFKLSRFVPWNNNIRANLFEDDETDENAVPTATPHYNANILFDLTMQRNQQILNEIFLENVRFQEGLLLLKIWLQQRELHVGFSGFHKYFLAMFIAYLFKQRKLHSNMSSYQVARTVWNQLANSNWEQNNMGISLCTAIKSELATNQPTLEQYHTYYDVVFIDVTGFYNICANLSLEIYKRVRMEAKLALDLLNDVNLNSFQLIFMTKYPLYSHFDHILKLNKLEANEQIMEMYVPPAEKLDYAGYAYPQLLKVVSSLLQKGLGERVLTLLPIEQPSEQWSVKNSARDCPAQLHLGIILNPDQAFEILDKGPESISESASEFRKFWGDKAQLRRFQDGSIAESVVWAAANDSMTKKRLIVRSMIKHLLQHHFQLDENDIDYIAGELDVVYRLSPAFKTDSLKYETPQDTDAETTSLYVIRAFDDLTRKLHALEELPLEIVSIAGISPVFRYCDPRPILPQARLFNKKMHSLDVHRGVMQLSISGKWPSQLTALRALKTAFYIQIAKLLTEKHKMICRVTYDGVLILKHGYVFGIELAHQKEVALLKKEKNERGITQYVDCEASIALELRHYILPKVNGALHSLYQSQPSFGGAVMIAKRWLYTQLIDSGLWPDECTELLIASQYINSNAQKVSCSPQTGFLRFISLLANTNWLSQIIIINFNNDMEEKEISALEDRFTNERESFPPLCIATSYDQKHIGKLWSNSTRPSVGVLSRVIILARNTLQLLESSILSRTESFIRPHKIFSASSQGYNLVIQLKPDMVSNALVYEFGSPFVDLTKPNWRLPLAGSNFVTDAVEKLRQAYSDFAMFFYNPCGGKEIGVVWKPFSIFAEKEFKVTDVNGCAISSKDITKVECKKEILIEDFKIILKDFYLRIDTVEAVKKASKETIFIHKANRRYFEQQKEDNTKVLTNNKRKYVKNSTESTPPSKLKKSNQKPANSLQQKSKKTKISTNVANVIKKKTKTK